MMLSTRDIVSIALFAALTAALGLFPPITLPATGVPVTAQSMGVMLAGALIGARRGGLALLLFAVLVAIGLPRLAGGRGGIGIYFGPTAGFVLSWPIAAYVTGWLFDKHRGQPHPAISALYLIIGGIGIVYVIGWAWLAVMNGWDIAKTFTAALPFIPGDLVKVALTVVIARGVKKAIPNL